MCRLISCFFTGFFFLMSTTAFAQVYSTANNGIENFERKDTVKNWRFGIFIAPDISWMRPTTSKSDDGNFEVKNKGNVFGFTYGILADYSFGRNYVFGTGLQVNTTGGRILSTRIGDFPSDKSFVKSADYRYRLTYLEMPATLKLYTSNTSPVRFFAQAGLMLGINISKKADYTVLYTDENGSNQTAVENRVRINGSFAIAPVMLQMNLGLGVEFPFNEKKSALLGVFFNNGFLPDATNPKKYNTFYGPTFRDGRTRLNNLSLRLGMFF